MKRITRTILGTGVFCTLATAYALRDTAPPQIRFDIGQNIYETAKKSGAPRYGTGNVAGLVSYELVDLPLDIPALYNRPGYEIKAMPLFAFTMYADEDFRDGLAVHTATLQFSRHAAKSHASAQTFVGDLISQFQKGKWRRYIREGCPAITGRSTFLNEHGQPGYAGYCSLDPTYKLSSEDWLRIMPMSQIYQWIGEGVLATLTVRYSDDVRGITYSIDLDFDDLEVKKRYEEMNLNRELAEGDAQGWNSTARHKSDKLAHQAKVRMLEENARRRGDMVVER